MYEEYEEGITKLRERYGLKVTGVAQFTIVGKDGRVVLGSTGCHSGLRHYVDDFSPEYVVSDLMDTTVSEADRQLYIDWLVLRSPYADAFLVKDAAWCIEKRLVIANAHVAPNLMAAGLIASRFQSEDKNQALLQLMLEMVKAGVNEDLAFAITHFTRVGDDKVRFYPGDITHTVLSPDVDMKLIKNFLEHRAVNAKKSTYHKDHNYAGVHNLFGNGGDNTFSKYLIQNFKLVENPKSESKSLNPFLKAKVVKDNAGGITYPRKGFVQRMVDFQHDIFKEVGYEGIYHQQQLAV